MPDYDTYQSPFSWRYGSPEMRYLWSEANKRLLWRQVWLALAEIQAEFGLISPEQVQDLQRHVQQIDLERALAIEADIQHDLMAELKTFAEQSPHGGGALHLGATSMDIEDNADTLRVRQSLDLLLQKVRRLLLSFAGQIERYAALPVIGFTHLQPAEPTTLGYRLAQYAQDLWEDEQVIDAARNQLRGKGFKGAVGTSASYQELLGSERLADFEQRLSQRLDLPFYPLATQVYPRKQDYRVLSALAGLSASLYKFAFDLRLLQSPPLGEVSEPFGKRQVGSSAMPFKRNPIRAEKIDSLARLIAQYPRVAWDNAAHSLLERTLDDSANRRTIYPEAFLASDEILEVALKLVEGLQVDEAAAARNLSIYGPFAATERVLMALSKAGADRQEMHERLRQLAMQAWQAIRLGEPNPLVNLVAQDERLQQFLAESELRGLMQGEGHLGLAVEKARWMAAALNKEFEPAGQHK